MYLCFINIKKDHFTFVYNTVQYINLHKSENISEHWCIPTIISSLFSCSKKLKNTFLGFRMLNLNTMLWKGIAKTGWWRRILKVSKPVIWIHSLYKCTSLTEKDWGILFVFIFRVFFHGCWWFCCCWFWLVVLVLSSVLQNETFFQKRLMILFLAIPIHCEHSSHKEAVLIPWKRNEKK